MVSSDVAATEAEKVIIDFTSRCGAETTDDLRKLLEMLISKSGRAIEKTAELKSL